MRIRKIKTSVLGGDRIIMELLKLLAYEEKIGGFAVFDSRIEMLVLNFDQEKGLLLIQASASVDLPAGTIEGGFLKNKDSFVSSLKKLIAKIGKNIKVSSFIISLPANAVYCHNLSFPHTLSEKQIDDSIKLNLGFLLPMSLDKVYFDWETIESADISKKEMILCAAGRNAVDGFMQAFLEAGIAAVAIEFHSLSLSRVAALESEEPSLTATLLDGNFEISIIENGAIRFLQAFDLAEMIELEKDKNSKDIVVDRIKRAVDFYSANKNKKGYLNKIYLLGDYEKIKIYKDAISQIEGLTVEFPELLPVFPRVPMLENSNLTHIAFGSALRGLMPRSEDTIVSLMPMGTEEAYEQKRLMSFVKLVSDLVSVISIFFIAIFAGSWILMTILANNIEKSLSRQSALPEGLIEIKEKAVAFNEVVKQASALESQTPRWVGLIERIKSLAVAGITLNKIDVSLESIGIYGTALTRDTLLQFKIVLEKSELFTEVKVPFSYLEQKDNIPFSLNLKLKNPNIIYE